LRPAARSKRVIAQISGSVHGGDLRLGRFGVSRGQAQNAAARDKLEIIAAPQGSIRNSSRAWRSNSRLKRPNERFFIMLKNFSTSISAKLFRDVSVLQLVKEAAGFVSLGIFIRCSPI